MQEVDFNGGKVALILARIITQSKPAIIEQECLEVLSGG